MTQESFSKTLEAHKLYLRFAEGGVRANLSGADLSGAHLADVNLSCANLYGANLSGTNLSGANLYGAIFTRADLSGANLSHANLSSADLYGANLSGADLSDADLSAAELSDTNLSNVNLPGANLSGANLSGAKNLLSAIDFVNSHFVRATDGYIVYMTFDGAYSTPDHLDIKPGSIVAEIVNPDRCTLFGSGIHVAPLEWVKQNCDGDIWKCLIRREWLPGVVVPYNTDGRIRCERLELIEIMK